MIPVSCVIPCYNAAPWLRETLDSVLSQSYPPLEILLVDDGSTDASAAIAASYGSRVQVIRQANRGESVARNRGIDEARGQWVALLDADDRWEADKLEKQWAATAESSELVCVYTDAFAFDDRGWRYDIVRPEWHARPERRLRMLCCSEAGVIPSSALVRTAPARQVRFPENTQHAEDMIFFACLRDRGPFHRVPQPLTGYRVSSTAQSAGPGFRFRSVRSRHGWLETHADRYTRDEYQQGLQLLAEELIVAHDLAFWARDHRTVRRCRAYYMQLKGGRSAVPHTFRRPLFPGLLLRLKDWFDRRNRHLSADSSRSDA